MQTVEATRREKLSVLIREAGSQAALSEKIEKAPAQISQWLNASINSKTGKPRVMSNGIAREIEKKIGKPVGWMDQPTLPALEQSNARPITSLPAKVTLEHALEVVAMALSSVPPEKRQALLGVLATYSSNPAQEKNSLDYLQSELAKTESRQTIDPTTISTGQRPGGKD